MFLVHPPFFSHPYQTLLLNILESQHPVINTPEIPDFVAGMFPEDPIKEPTTESLFVFSDFAFFHVIFLLQLNLANANADEREKICSACQSLMPPHPLLILMSVVAAETHKITADKTGPPLERHKLGGFLLSPCCFFIS